MSVSTRSNPKKRASKRWVITVATLLMLAMFPAAWLLIKKTTLVKELTKYNDPAEQTNEEDVSEPGSALIESFIIKEFNVKIPNQPKAAKFKVYWQAESIYLLIDSLEKLPLGERYEVWSVAGTNRNSLGFFDAPAGRPLIIKAEKANMTDDYDIKIIKENPVPQ
jgi:hypothetical protein